MKKVIKYTGILMLLLIFFSAGVLVADKMTLRNEVIRLHVVANSDSDEDQRIKIAVKDEIVSYLQESIAKFSNAEQAKDYLSSQLPQLEELANSALINMGSKDKVTVHFMAEKFDVREYDTFSLPSGVYESLRVEIGQGDGRNWWCVVFPTLCLPTSAEGFEDVAVSAGLGQSLVNTLSLDRYEIRFYFLDCLGRLEKIISFL